MTEQEIITYLKENKTKGVAFAFMPHEVANWCCEHSNEEIFHIFHHSSWNGKCDINCRDNAIYCLDEDYEPKAEFVPHWEEFEIDKEGFFHIKRGSDFIYYHWFYWQKFLRENFDNYKNFGGWLYIDSDEKPTWHTSPRIKVGGLVFTYAPIDIESKPATPTKIRFWRCAE